MTSRRVRRLQSVVGSAALAVPLTIASVGTASAAPHRPHPVTSIGLLRRAVSTLEPGDSIRITWTDASGTPHTTTLTA